MVWQRACPLIEEGFDSAAGHDAPKSFMRFEHLEPVQFLTFSCKDRIRFFQSDEAKDIAVDYLAMYRLKYGLQLFSWVVMPDHVHILVMADPKIVPLSSFLSSYKTRVSKKVLALTGSIAPLWEPGRGFLQSAISEFSFSSNAAYIEENPVRAGLAASAELYKWSSAGSQVIGRDDW